jgi:hypothetical protein
MKNMMFALPAGGYTSQNLSTHEQHVELGRVALACRNSPSAASAVMLLHAGFAEQEGQMVL